MAAPVNTVLPAITGTVAVGSTLTLSNGTWTGTPTSYAYAWLRAGVAIAGEVAATYLLSVADIGLAITGRVTATNVDGSTAADSTATIAVPSTLTVETGAGITGADSYGTLAQLAAHHVKYGNTTWAALTAYAQEVAARKAAEYMLGNYRASWKGVRMTATQGLDWPRGYVYITPFLNGASGEFPYLVADDIVPDEVFRAFADLALKASTAELNPDLGKDIISQTVGPISTTYSAGSPQQKRYRAIDMLLRPYLNGNGLGANTPVMRS
jgi:hypothetical protein